MRYEENNYSVRDKKIQHFFGAAGRNRTGTVFPPRDFKSLTSTNFVTAAYSLSTNQSSAHRYQPDCSFPDAGTKKAPKRPLHPVTKPEPEPQRSIFNALIPCKSGIYGKAVNRDGSCLASMSRTARTLPQTAAKQMIKTQVLIPCSRLTLALLRSAMKPAVRGKGREESSRQR